MSIFFAPYLITLAAILGLMTCAWSMSVILQDTSIIDIFWGGGFVLAVWLYFAFTPDGFPARKWLITILVTIWGGRLALYLLWRSWGEEEDWRYQNLRQNGGKWWWLRSLIVVFGLQGTVMWIVSTPLLAAQISPRPNQLTWLDYGGLLLWGIGFLFEALSDWQLARFKANPDNQGKLLTHGLWRYTRHPNYFGDALQWWGLFLIAAGTTNGYLTVFSPLIMTFLLLHISGVALLETRLKVSKPRYEDYVVTTNAFFPWFPKNNRVEQ